MIKKPVLIIHGDKDDLVNINQSKKFIKYLENGSLIIFKNVGHTFYGKKIFNRMMKEVEKFFDKNLK